MPDHRARLAAIKRFDQLVTYLRDDMGWPIEGDDFEEITFDYTPDELGIDAANRAKIQQIKRLRPLAANQPWGIFFVRFEPKRLPVVALRRILSRVVLKKRAAANSPERAAWDLADLLFISNYGDDAERRISFAHFVQDDDWGDLPTLKVLGWDGDDTNLHLDEVARKLTTKLRWPDDEADVPGWRATWGDAFTLRHREVITTAKRLAERLADLARETRKKANAALAIESPTGPLRTLMDAFKKALIHDLDDDGFADMYAQTIAYGLLSARISRPAGLTADNMADMVPVTNPFLKEMLESFLRLGGRQRSGQGWTGIDFDELGINEIVQLLREANMEAVLRDFGDRNPQEDPVIHFYESFLKEYDAKKRMQRGVFYTPRPVVSYIVRSVHELLQNEFGLADGLADTATWGEILDRHPGLKLPLLSDSPGETQTISPDEPFVQILDPATGTTTFLVEVIEVIHQTLKAKWKEQRLTEAQQVAAWNDYVPRHLLPRLHGFELMMAPFAIAHMKIGLKLAETGYRFGSEERARIYLTNALEPWIRQLPFIGFEALAHEADAVNEIKRHKRFTVVIGNPPYAKLSANRSPYAESLVEPYKRLVSEERNVQPLSDDYVKFTAFAIQLTRTSPLSVVSLITNRSWLDGLIHRGMRKAILGEFNRVSITDCHGDNNVGEDVPAGRQNDNLFDIRQGVSICCFVRNLESAKLLEWGEIWGSRAEKYNELSRMTFQSATRQITAPVLPNYFFKESSENPEADSFLSYPSLVEIFGTGDTRADQGQRYGNGIKSNRDGLLIDFDKSVLKRRMLKFADKAVTDAELKLECELEDGPYWNTSRERAKIDPALADSMIFPITYRPFDPRWIWYQVNLIQIGRGGASRKLMLNLAGKDNLALLSSRNSQTPEFSSAFCTRYLSEMKTAESTRASYCFPLYVEDEVAGLDFGAAKAPNFSRKFLSRLAGALGLPQTGAHNLPAGLTPEDIFHHAYAVFHSPGYRSRYAEFLKIDFPRLPLTGDLALFRALAELGSELVALHLLESPILDRPMTGFIGSRNPEVEMPTWSNDTVWVDKRRTAGFKGVPKDVWNFHVGGYQVCHKWLKDRKGRTLSDDDIAHYHKVVVALSETIRLMQEIDAVIDQHGGWPGAFVLNSGERA